MIDRRIKEIAAAFILLLFAPYALHADDGLAFPLKENTVTARINNVDVELKVQGTAWVKLLDQALSIRLDSVTDLSDLQSKMGDIIRTSLNHDDDCDYKLDFNKADLVPRDCEAAPHDDKQLSYCQAAELEVGAHFEKWACALGAKTRILEQNLSASLRLQPRVSPSRIDFDSTVESVSADGLLGSLIGVDTFRDRIVQMLNQQMGASLQALKSSQTVSFPPEFSGYSPHFESAEFRKDAGNQLLIHIQASGLMSTAQAQDLLQKLQQMHSGK